MDGIKENSVDSLMINFSANEDSDGKSADEEIKVAEGNNDEEDRNMEDVLAMPLPIQ